MGYVSQLTIWILITKHSWMHCQIFSGDIFPKYGGEGPAKWDFHRKSRKTSPPPKLTQGTGLSTARGVSNGNGNFTSRKTAPHRQLSVEKTTSGAERSQKRGSRKGQPAGNQNGTANQGEETRHAREKAEGGSGRENEGRKKTTQDHSQNRPPRNGHAGKSSPGEARAHGSGENTKNGRNREKRESRNFREKPG